MRVKINMLYPANRTMQDANKWTKRGIEDWGCDRNRKRGVVQDLEGLIWTRDEEVYMYACDVRADPGQRGR